MNDIRKEFNEKNVWRLGTVYDLTKYFNDLAREGKIIGVIDSKDKCIYEHGYFVCHDVWDTHIYRIQVGINAEYDDEPRTKIIEQEDIHHSDLMDYCIEKYGLNKDILTHFDEREYTGVLISRIGIKEVLKSIVEMDYNKGFENWDVTEFRYDRPLEDLIKRIDGGYGISKIDIDVDKEEDLEETMGL